MAQCALCLSVADAIRKRTPDPEEYMWEYRKVQQNAGCTTCQNIALIFERTPWGVSPSELSGFLGSLGYDNRWRLRLERQNSKGCEKYIDMQANAASNALRFRPLEREINIEGIKRWISRCDRDHAGSCHRITNPWVKMPHAIRLRFIDVEKLCLVKQPDQSEPCRYAALSYVWGTTGDSFQTNKANVEALSQNGAFELPCNRNRLPNTIFDSISLARALHIPYLWVDRFCIVQDDVVAKPYQLASMASIYSSAYVTIAATEGEDSDYGLPGINKERLRKTPFEEFSFSPNCHYISADPVLGGEFHTTYHTRAWTFQEWTFSCRTIVFHHQTVSWICETLVQQENGVYPSRVPNKPARDGWDKSPKIISYCYAVERYSQRKLSQPEDVLAAFNAFMTIEGRVVKGDIVFGIPELFFDRMLCWHHGVGSLQHRRTDSQGNILKDFPSWSWAGWFRPLDMSLAKAASEEAMRRYDSPCLTYPHFCDFYKIVIEPHGERKERIRDLDYYKTRGLTDIVEAPYLPNFDLEFPVVQEDEIHDVIDEHVHSTIIEFRTRRLIASRSHHDLEDIGKETPTLIGPRGQMIGILDLNISFAAVRLPQHDVELICISMSGPVCEKHAHLRKSGTRYLHRECDSKCFIDLDHWLASVYAPASKWQFRCYDVLWIE